MGFLQMQDKIETQKGENKILRQKLQSSDALFIETLRGNGYRLTTKK